MNNHFTILTLGYNSQPWIRHCMDSIVNQDYDNFDVIAIDACTTDGTFDTLQEYEEKHDHMTLVRKNHRCFQVENTRHGVLLSKPNSIIVTVDFDDWLPDNQVLNRLNSVYNPDVWMTYGTYSEFHGVAISTFPPGFFYRYPDEVVENNDFRSHRWLASHLRTFRRELFLSIKEEDMIDPVTNRYYDMAGDFCFMLPMIEMAGERFEYIPETMYVYNRTNELSEDKHDHRDGTVGVSRQEQIADSIRNKQRYSRLDSLENLSHV